MLLLVSDWIVEKVAPASVQNFATLDLPAAPPPPHPASAMSTTADAHMATIEAGKGASRPLAVRFVGTGSPRVSARRRQPESPRAGAKAGRRSTSSKLLPALSQALRSMTRRMPPEVAKIRDRTRLDRFLTDFQFTVVSIASAARETESSRVRRRIARGDSCTRRVREHAAVGAFDAARMSGPGASRSQTVAMVSSVIRKRRGSCDLHWHQSGSRRP
jgi:hypothetical protein